MTRFVFSIETRITTAYSWSLVSGHWSAATKGVKTQEAWLGDTYRA